jgi:hypothetical protein
MEKPHLTRAEFLKLSRLSDQNFSQISMRNEVSLMYGAPCPALYGHYLALDAVGMRVAGGLSEMLIRAEAAAITNLHWSVWVDGVGRAEWDLRHIYFSVGMLETGKGARAKREFLVCSGTPREIADDFERNSFRGARFVAVNLKLLLADMREIAADEAIEMPDPLLPRPDSPEYLALIREGEEHRKKALQRMREKVRGRRGAQTGMRAQ